MSEKVRPGQVFRPKASTWNKFVDATRNVGSRSDPRLGYASTDIYVENRSGGDLDRFSVLGIDSVTTPHATNSSEFFRHIVLEGSTPAFSSDHVGKFVVLLEPAKNNGFARCAMSGLVQVQVNVTDADHEWCDVADSDDAKLTSYGAASARIVHKPSGTGTKWCVVNLAQSYGAARRYEGQQVGALLDTDTENGVDNLIAIDGVPVETSSVTAKNRMGWSADDNAVTFVEWNAEDKVWVMYQVDGCA